MSIALIKDALKELKEAPNKYPCIGVLESEAALRQIIRKQKDYLYKLEANFKKLQLQIAELKGTKVVDNEAIFHFAVSYNEPNGTLASTCGFLRMVDVDLNDITAFNNRVRKQIGDYLERETFVITSFTPITI